tara:strand:- start:289 stop:537 length:249 start_codon:yes stop_codon:yes gene_type:complete
MTKSKLVELADEVLADIYVDMESVLREKLEEALADKLSRKFKSAYYYHYEPSKSDRKKHKKNYESVKPIFDDCIDKLLGETK